MILRRRLFTTLIMALCLSPSTAAPGKELDPEAVKISGRYYAIALGPGSLNLSNYQVIEVVRSAKGLPEEEVYYSLVGDDAFVYELKAARLAGLLSEFGQDRLVVTPQTPPSPRLLEPEMWQALHHQFDRQTGRVPLHIDPSYTKVRFGIIDTSPTDDVKPERHPGRSRHGHAMLNMARSLLCSTPTGDECVIDLTSQLGLAYYRDRLSGTIIRDEIGGGDMGSLIDLARAITAEVTAWQDQPFESELVINLSVGWDARHGGLAATPAAMAPDVRAVYRAIERAVCLGATVIAAAGNHGGRGSHGFWGPAFWESHPAPTHARCEKVLGRRLDPAGFPAPGDFYRPLLYAASGLRHDRRPLSNASPESQARFAVYGGATAVLSHIPNLPTETYAGSSVATVGLSAMAAAVAYYRSDLPVYKRMQILYESGDDLGRPADACLGACGQDNNAFTSRAITMCEALTEACDHPLQPCSVPPACPTPVGIPPDLPSGLIAFFSAASPAQPFIDALTEEISLPPICQAATLHYDPDDGPLATLCAENELFAGLALPPVRPGPETVPCPTCVFYQNFGTLLVEIDPRFESDVKDATLNVCGTSYRLSIPLHRGALSLVTGLPPTSGCDPARLSFLVDDPIGGMSVVINPLLVMP